MDYQEIGERRRQLRIDGFATLADVGFDGDWVSPYQISSRSKTGPVLLALHWLDVSSITQHHAILTKLGFLPGILFNKVLGQALVESGLTRSHIYVTQAFHLLPKEQRSEGISRANVDISFDQVTRHELSGRRVIALGGVATAACRRHGISHTVVCHPSARGRTISDKALEIGTALAG
ncbi:hypothetical protein A6U87_16700 [Rhizobium sp. AC44/96]|uniref:hypothetical protein n=1 Tax=Rhizobium sp. AC44/96 TaxID=1841654 RepID=UPI00080FB5A7|nr:hypothetical protein [Rhizobium sp. AC44/96]OCJ03588.1 hypothetical protein A6U87_16700 [Rhizobium sp. AC44/96]